MVKYPGARKIRSDYRLMLECLRRRVVTRTLRGSSLERTPVASNYRHSQPEVICHEESLESRLSFCLLIPCLPLAEPKEAIDHGNLLMFLKVSVHEHKQVGHWWRVDVKVQLEDIWQCSPALPLNNPSCICPGKRLMSST